MDRFGDRFGDKLVGFYGVVSGLHHAPPPHATVVQLRVKGAGSADLVAAGRRLRDALGDIPLIMNDRIDIALAVGAAGVHLGQTDIPAATARRMIGDRLVLGISTHNEQQVRNAVAAGADYIGYGPVFATTTKTPLAPIQGLGALRRAVDCAGKIPVVAIGGITPDRAANVAAAGAAAACVIAAVNDAADPKTAAATIAAAFART